ncbi:Lysine-specific demethylase 3B [Coemansia interrupta]|uniref:Lysine-specific demethylase 3B n=1 Tax=Coemansia interrupta TaxID=1126814 RepID=A0A9W8HEC2_9FUNG|nr:Lysine-specific demethylase 3B [Coemansia interrupta]
MPAPGHGQTDTGAATHALPSSPKRLPDHNVYVLIDNTEFERPYRRQSQGQGQDNVQTPDSGNFEANTMPYVLIEHTTQDRKLIDGISERSNSPVAQDPSHTMHQSVSELSEDPDSGCATQVSEEAVLKDATKATEESSNKASPEPEEQASEDASMASADEDSKDPAEIVALGDEAHQPTEHPLEGVLKDASIDDILPLAAEMTLDEVLGDPLDEITTMLPTPEELFSPEFEHIHLDASSYEPAHTLTVPRVGSGMTQSTYEYRLGDFISPVDPCLWLQFMRRKFSHWAKSHSAVESVDVRLIPQQYNCRTTNRYHQPQCRGCIKRISDQRCGFANIRYTAQLQIKLVDGVSKVFYILRPMFRSEIEKVPALRQPVTPIFLPGARVLDNDDSWIEFHILCQTVSTIKPLLRAELAVVRDLTCNELRTAASGSISFVGEHVSEPDAVVPSLSSSAVHPLYGCSPLSCIMRRMPMGVREKCEKCAAPIFSAHFSCCLCMTEMCIQCFEAWDDSLIEENYFTVKKGTKSEGGTKVLLDMSYCKRTMRSDENGDQIHHSTRHKKCQFVRVSHFTADELELMLRKVNRIVKYCDHLDETQPAGYSSISLCANELGLKNPDQATDMSWIYEELDTVDKDTRTIVNMGDVDFGADPALRSLQFDASPINTSPKASTSRSQSAYLEGDWKARLQSELLVPKYPLPAWHMAPIYVSASDLSLRELAQVWGEDSRVVVATDLLEESDLCNWKPKVLLQSLARLPVQVNRMGAATAPTDNWSLDQFLCCFSDDCTAAGAGDSEESAAFIGKLRGSRLRAYARLHLDSSDKPETASNTKHKESDVAMDVDPSTDVAAELETVTDNKARGRPRGASKASGKTDGKAVAKGVAKPKAAAKSVAKPKPKARGKEKDAAVPESLAELKDTTKEMAALQEKIDAATERIPFASYTSKGGRLNLVNRLPARYAQPDMRPEIQFTYGVCGTGSPDNLRCDASDMINLLLYSSTAAETQASLDPAQVQTQPGIPRKSGTRRAGKQTETKSVDDDVAVQWTIFPPGAGEYIRDFNNRDDSHDPIHDRSVFMDAKACSRMYESYDDEEYRKSHEIRTW